MTPHATRRRRKIKCSDSGRQNLFEVMTVQEAAAIFCVTESTIRYAIDRGKIAARQNTKGRTWLISKNSLIDIYGHSPIIKSKKLHQKP